MDLITNDQKESLQAILDKSFNLFLQYSHILGKDDLQALLHEARPEQRFVNISLGIAYDPCEWLLILDDEPADPNLPFCKEYILIIEYKLNDGLVFEALYSLVKDIKRNILCHTRNFTRIVEATKDGRAVPHLVSEGNEIGIYAYGPPAG